MKTSVAVMLLLSTHAAFAGIVIESVPISAADLESKGVIVTKTSSRSGVPSVTVQVEIGTAAPHETFRHTDFVISQSEVIVESLRIVDGRPHDWAARRERSTAKSASFIAFGKEVSRGYVAVEFLVPSESQMAHYRRYLIPLSEIPEK